MANKKKKRKAYGYRSLKKMTRDDLINLLPAGSLDHGSHDDPHVGEDDGGDNIDGELCLMEAVAYITGEPHSDHPQCACPVLTELGIKFNDSHELGNSDLGDLDDLISAIPSLVNSRTGSKLVRFKRAKAISMALLPLAIVELDGEFHEPASEALLRELTSLSGLRGSAQIKRAKQVLNVLSFEDAHGGPAVSGLSRLLKVLARTDYKKGLSASAYQSAFPVELASLFEHGWEQANLLTTLGNIRS